MPQCRPPSFLSLREEFSDKDSAMAQKRIAANARMMKRNRRHDYTPTALVVCEQCGKPVHGYSTNDYRYYRPTCEHGGVIRAGDLEATVWNELLRGLQQPALVLAEVSGNGRARSARRMRPRCG
jgi:hypothetical protein